MKESDSMTMGQYIAACCISVFSPVSRLLPKAVLKRCGSSGWLAPLAAFVPLLLLVLFMGKLLHSEGDEQGLAQTIEAKLGRFWGKAANLVLCIWIILYGGFLLRSGAERLLSTVYPTGSLFFFLPVLLLLSLTLALGSVRAMGRCSSVTLLLFAQALILVFLMALPTLKLSYVWPPDVTKTDEILLSAVPVLDVLSPWIWFSFLRNRVRNEPDEKRKETIAAVLMTFLTILFLLCTIGILGPELSQKMQYPFFVMVKNLRLFNVAERFDALVIILWIMTDYICIGMLLRSASEGLCCIFDSKKSFGYVLLCGGLTLAASFFIAPNALAFEKLSEKMVPMVNLILVFLCLPLFCLLGALRKKSQKKKNRC